MGNNGRRRGGMIGIALLIGYFVLRFGLFAWREHQEGMSTGAIVLSLIGLAVGIVVLLELILLGYHAHSARRERALAEQHPGALLVPVRFSRELAGQVEYVAGTLGLPQDRAPRRDYGTLVADGHGIGLYVGGATPRLVLGLPRNAVVSVASGDAKAVGRYGFGRVDAIRVLAGNPAAPVALEVPAHRIVLGFPRNLRPDELDECVRRIAAAVGVAVFPVTQR